MKKNILFSVVFLISILATSNAEDCVRLNQPIQSKCYKSVTSEEQIDKDKRYIYIETTTKQVEIPCAGESQKQIDYQVALVRYDVCLKVNNLNKSSNYLKTESYRNSYESVKSYCPQNFTQIEKDTALKNINDLEEKLTRLQNDYQEQVAKFSNGTFTFSQDEQIQLDNTKLSYDKLIQEAIENNREYNTQTQVHNNLYGIPTADKDPENEQNVISLRIQKDRQIAIITNSFSSARKPFLKSNFDLNSKKIKKELDKEIELSNCPFLNKNSDYEKLLGKEKTSCPLNSEPNNKNECICVQGFYSGAGESFGTCVPQKQAWEDSGLFLYGDPNSHKASIGYECNEGYSPNFTKSKCLLNNKDLGSVSSSTQNNLFYKKEYKDEKVTLEKNISSTSLEDLDKVKENEKKLLDTLLPTSTTNIIKGETVTLIQKLKNFFRSLFNLK